MRICENKRKKFAFRKRIDNSHESKVIAPSKRVVKTIITYSGMPLSFYEIMIVTKVLVNYFYHKQNQQKHIVKM